MCDFSDYAEARAAARRFLPRAIFDYVDRGTEAETALGAHRHAFDRMRVVPRVLQPVAAPDLRARILDRPRSLPLIVAPTALAGIMRHDGEVALARAADAAGMPFCVSTQSSTSIEDIRRGAPQAELWFQLYVWRDRQQTWALLDRVARQDVTTLLLTVDTPAAPKKVHNLRNGFSIPLRPGARLVADLLRHPRWSLGVMGRYALSGGLPSYAHYPGEVAGSIAQAIRDPRFALDMVLDRDFLHELRRRWPGKLLVKGVLDPRDVRMALQAGCDGVVVSSHGARNHDTAVTPLDMLPRIRAVAGGATVLADSGVQRGGDAAKLLAAGADGVLLGRAPLYGLAAGGQDGALRILAILTEELRQFLVFSGAPDLAAMTGLEWQGLRPAGREP